MISRIAAPFPKLLGTLPACFVILLQVKGQRTDVNSNIRTRARAKQQAEQWQMVPLPAKLIALLADSVAESRTNKTAGDCLSCIQWLVIHKKGIASCATL